MHSSAKWSQIDELPSPVEEASLVLHVCWDKQSGSQCGLVRAADDFGQSRQCIFVSWPSFWSTFKAGCKFLYWWLGQKIFYHLLNCNTCTHTHLSLHLAALEVIISEISRKGNCLWTRLCHILEVIISSLADVTPSVKSAATLAKNTELSPQHLLSTHLLECKFCVNVHAATAQWVARGVAVIVSTSAT